MINIVLNQKKTKIHKKEKNLLLSLLKENR